MSRYTFGWNDPLKSFKTDNFKFNQRRNTGLEDVPTEVLRSLWLIKFNGRAAPMVQLYEDAAEDFADVAQELNDRKLVRYEEHYAADIAETKRYFVLEKDDADN